MCKELRLSAVVIDVLKQTVTFPLLSIMPTSFLDYNTADTRLYKTVGFLLCGCGKAIGWAGVIFDGHANNDRKKLVKNNVGNELNVTIMDCEY